jgi:hypothetical protein
MIAKLCRRYYETQTEGELEVFDEDTGELEFVCKTLELPWKDNERNVSCIPEGFYDVVPRQSPKYGNHLHVTGVEGRSLILFHYANYVGSDNPRTGSSDLRGCIAVGERFGDITGDGIVEILNSKKTMKALMDVAPNGFVLEITQ